MCKLNIFSDNNLACVDFSGILKLYIYLKFTYVLCLLLNYNLLFICTTLTINSRLFFLLMILASFVINNEGIISKTYICPKCGKKYKHQPSLCNHRRYECGVLPQFRCEICNRLFSRSHRLRMHIMVSHNRAFKID